MVRECGLQGLLGRLNIGVDSQEIRFLRGRADDFEKRQWNRSFFPLAVPPGALFRSRIHLECQGPGRASRSRYPPVARRVARFRLCSWLLLLSFCEVSMGCVPLAYGGAQP